MIQVYLSKPFYCYVFHSHSCKICNTYYWDLKRLRSHSSRCSRKQNKLVCLCDICGKEFKNDCSLRKHRKEHSDLKQIYECFLCKKIVCSKFYLAYHIQTTHVGGKPKFQCDSCGKTFHRKMLYNRHKTVHTNDFPFSCTYCEKKFRLKDNLNVCINWPFLQLKHILHVESLNHIQSKTYILDSYPNTHWRKTL